MLHPCAVLLYKLALPSLVIFHKICNCIVIEGRDDSAHIYKQGINGYLTIVKTPRQQFSNSPGAMVCPYLGKGEWSEVIPRVALFLRGRGLSVIHQKLQQDHGGAGCLYRASWSMETIKIQLTSGLQLENWKWIVIYFESFYSLESLWRLPPGSKHPIGMFGDISHYKL